jgi:hypothetical protein
MRAYIDSDVLIWHLRGDKRAATLLRGLSRDPDLQLWTGALQRAEVVFFMRENEVAATMSFLSRFKTQPVTQEIVDKAGQFYRQWHPSHGIDVNDAILAASAVVTGGRIYTLNVKHYPIPALSVAKAW